jgi:hypothetical protein
VLTATGTAGLIQGETNLRFNGSSLNLTGSLNVFKSGSVVFDVQGSFGQLFSITDNLIGDIFSVADISGIPILNVNSNGNVDVDGELRVTGDVYAYFSSDERLKNNITPISGSLDKLKQINGYEFDWNEKSNYEGHDIGVIAQEIEKVLPELVSVRRNGYLGVDYPKIVALLIETNKELLKRVEILESKIK